MLDVTFFFFDPVPLYIFNNHVLSGYDNNIVIVYRIIFFIYYCVVPYPLWLWLVDLLIYYDYFLFVISLFVIPIFADMNKHEIKYFV